MRDAAATVHVALSEEDGWSPYFAVGTMREIVATSMTEETYQLYALLYQQQAEGAPPLLLRCRPARHPTRGL